MISCNQSSIVCLLQKRFAETGSIGRRKRNSSLQISRAAQDQYLIQLSFLDLKASSSNLKTAREEESGVQASTFTVGNHLDKPSLVGS